MTTTGQVCPYCASVICECDDARWDGEEMSDEEMAEEECGRWINGRLSALCTKAGSEECDWICPLSSGLRYRRRKRR